MRGATLAKKCALPLDIQAKRIIKKYGLTVFDPSPATCYSDSAGTTLTTQDGVVGRINCSNGTSFYASQATAGYKPILRKGAKNLLTYSEDFSNAAWNKTGSATVTGTNQLNFPIQADYNGIFYNYTLASVGVTYTASVVLSGSGTITLALREGGGAYSYLAIKDITLTSTPTRYSVSAAATYTSLRLFIVRTTPTVFNDTATTVTANKAMIETGSTASTYVATTTVPLSNGIGPWWMDFDGVDDYLALNAVPFQMADNSLMMCTVSSLTFPVTPAIRFMSLEGASSGHIGLMLNTAGMGEIWRNDAGTNNIRLDNSTLNNKRVITAVKQSTTVLRKNTVVKFSDANITGATTLTSAIIGGSVVYSVRLSGAIYSLIIGKLNTLISESELKILEKVYAKKADLTI